MFRSNLIAWNSSAPALGALLAAASLFASVGCASQNTQPESTADERTSETSSTESHATAAPRSSAVDERVEEARERVSKTEAGKLVWKSIQFHGGLKRWYANGPLFFRYDYRPIDGRTVRDTYNGVDSWGSRARQQLADDRQKEFGWDGERAWVSPSDAELEINARFWALTPYYFIGMPFVLADPGVQLEKKGTAELHGRPHVVVKATFGKNVGDSPDDYYVVYLDRETGRFGGLRYIVSYPGFFPDGGHSPPKLMVYKGEQTIDGITFAEEFPTYKWNPDEETEKKTDSSSGNDVTPVTEGRGEQVTEITLTDVEFRPETPDSYFDAPDSGRVLEGY